MLNLLLNIESLRADQRTGIPHYAWNLFNEIQDCEEISSLYAFNGNEVVQYVPGPANKLTYKEPLFPFLGKIRRSQEEIHQTHPAFKSFGKNKKIKNLIYHEPNFILKPFKQISIPTLHDLSPIRFPDLQTPETVRWYEQKLKTTLRQARHFITGSDFIRNEAMQLLGIKPRDITTIYHGVSNAFKPRDKQETKEILHKYGLKYQKYILSVATFEPRKNLDKLLKAYLSLANKIRQKYPLVLVGADGWKTNDFLEKAKQSEHVKMLGYIPQEDLTHIFSGAKLFSYLSSYEGFGLPVLEALASGLPVLTSENTSMAEFSKDQAFLVNPHDVNAISAGFAELLFNDEFASTALAMANFYQENFSWKKCAAATLEVFKQQIQ